MRLQKFKQFWLHFKDKILSALIILAPFMIVLTILIATNLLTLKSNKVYDFKSQPISFKVRP